MHRLPDELRLLLLLAVNSFVLFSCVRFVRRRGVRDGPQIALDAILLWYVVQYVSVGLPGLIGVLSAASMCTIAVVISIGLTLSPAPRAEVLHQTMSDADRRSLLASFGLICAFVGAVTWNQRLIPPLANDAVTYHLPAAAQWIQTGRLGLFETWYFNPANTYSPLAGSIFIAWLMAPLSNDVLAQFVEAPALLMIFLATLQLSRALGANVRAASLIALAACASRPFISQTVLTKDDLFVTALFGAAVMALDDERLRDALGTWRVGAAIGLLLSTKYPALLSVPIFLLAWDAPRSANWSRRRYVTAILVAFLLAGPWYARNAILTGNPLFPIDVSVGPFTLFRGMFTSVRALRLGTFEGIDATLFHSYASLPSIVALALLGTWVAALVRFVRKSSRSPIERLVLFGPVVGIVLFVCVSPYAEVRFVYPSFLLLFATAALALGWFKQSSIAAVPALALVLLSAATSFERQVLIALATPAIFTVFAAVIGASLIEFSRRSRHVAYVATTSCIAALACLIYVFWQAYLGARGGSEHYFWSRGYGNVADAWASIRQREMPPGTVIAYAGMHFVYPLFGHAMDRHIVYAPVRADVRSIADLGRIDKPITGDDLPRVISELMVRDASREAWLSNLRASGARFLLIDRTNADVPPPEFEFAQNDPRFVKAFEVYGTIVYEVRW